MKEKINYSNLEANLDFLLNNKLINKKDKILEIGSGKGVLLNNLFRKGYNIVGLEVNNSFLKRSKKLFGKKLPLYLTKGTKLNFEANSFDVVLSFDVLEHIPETNNHFQEVRRILKPNGRYLFCIPNKLTNIPYEIIRQKSLTKYKEWHCSLYSVWGIKKRLKRNNFKTKFYNQKIFSAFFLDKIKKSFGGLGLNLIRISNPDLLPIFLKPSLYVEARKIK